MTAASNNLHLPPDPCWVLEFKDGKGAVTSQETGCVYGLSTEELLHQYAGAANVPMDRYHPVAYSWSDFVKKCSRGFPGVTIDHPGQPGFYKTIPFQR